jgi:hypothetical protein
MEPHMMGRLLLAERLMQSSAHPARDEQRSGIINQVLAWPLPGTVETADEQAEPPEPAPE